MAAACPGKTGTVAADPEMEDSPLALTPKLPPADDDPHPVPPHPGGEREDILRARPVPREAASQRGQWASGHTPGTRKDRKRRTHRKLT